MRKSVIECEIKLGLFFVFLTESKLWLTSHFDVMSIQIWMSDVYVGLTKEHSSFMLTTCEKSAKTC